MSFSDSDPERKYDLTTFGLSENVVNSDDDDSEMDDSSEEEEEEDSEMYDSEEEDSEMYDSEEEDSDDSSEEKEVRPKKVRKRKEEEDSDDDSSEEKEVRPKKVRKQKEKGPKEVRNWLELPPDVMSQIFLKLDTTDILFRVQSVCSVWRKLAKEPQLYRSIDMQLQWQYFDRGELDWEKMAKEAVDRSCGQCVDFAAESFPTGELMLYIADKHLPLRRLRLVSCYDIEEEALIETAKKLPLLEEVEIIFGSLSEAELEAFGHSCPLLKYFRLNNQGDNGPDRVGYDEEALSIAQSMPGLHHLHLFGNFLTDTGLQAILDGCPHLKSLDLRQCFSVKFGGDLKKRCAYRNIELKLPNDSTIGYEFDAKCIGDEDSDSQDSPPDSYFWFNYNNLDWCIALRRLRLVSCYRIYDEPFIETVKKLPLLEEVEICHYSFTAEVLEAIGHSCPLLKYFRLNRTGCKGPNRVVYDGEALSIARSMPGLHHLHLFGTFLTDTGLLAILDGCQHLKSIDLRQCFNVNFGGDLKKRCADRNIELKLPNDSTIGHEFDTSCGEWKPDSPPDSYFWFSDNLSF